MTFPFTQEFEAAELENENLDEIEETPKEWGLDFKSGQLTGRVVEGVEAVKVWAWLALRTQRYRYMIYSWDYGSEYEDLIGTTHTNEYLDTELKRMTEECLSTNKYIIGIENFAFEKQEECLKIRFKLLTVFGEEEMELYV
ncbi:DUF2634 domain-containing protein [Anaerovorax odorimutans]|uniref:DUF2634 domain-containing protein n=1 Tax=Anaerovorax odorimutans TaxID=109327 RepID=A0ABT1RR36_9FIRM|nr:DUF2634 domain-containing protein [Anaerovorax odorimutans]MCQ4637665.1 DUF2634 domain-containing protein [Anaerovorax odorimutans]